MAPDVEVDTFPTPMPRETMSWEVDARPDTSRDVVVEFVVVELMVLVLPNEVTPPTDKAPEIWTSPCTWRFLDVVVATPTPSPPVRYVLPAMERNCAGEDVPMPTFPPFSIVNAAGVDVAYASVEVPM